MHISRAAYFPKIFFTPFSNKQLIRDTNGDPCRASPPRGKNFQSHRKLRHQIATSRAHKKFSSANAVVIVVVVVGYERVTEMPRSRRRHRYRVSRSYLHLNRGLTSPLATAMNFIPVSYFWFPHCGVRGAPRRSFAINHLRRCRYSPPRGCIPNFRAIPRAKKKRRRGRRRVFDDSSLARISLLRLLLSSLSLPTSPVPSLSQTRIPQTPPGSVKYVRDARRDAGDLFVRKCRA